MKKALLVGLIAFTAFGLFAAGFVTDAWVRSQQHIEMQVPHTFQKKYLHASFEVSAAHPQIKRVSEELIKAFLLQISTALDNSDEEAAVDELNQIALSLLNSAATSLDKQEKIFKGHQHPPAQKY